MTEYSHPRANAACQVEKANKLADPVIADIRSDKNQVQGTVTTIDRICQSSVDQVDMQRLQVKAHVADIGDRLTNQRDALADEAKAKKDTLGSPFKEKSPVLPSEAIIASVTEHVHGIIPRNRT